MELAEIFEAIDRGESLTEAYIRQIVDKAPLPTPEQRDQLIGLLRPAK